MTHTTTRSPGLHLWTLRDTPTTAADVAEAATQARRWADEAKRRGDDHIAQVQADVWRRTHAGRQARASQAAGISQQILRRERLWAECKTIADRNRPGSQTRRHAETWMRVYEDESRKLMEQLTALRRRHA